MSRCRPVSSRPRGGVWPLVLVILAACGGAAEEPPKRPTDRGVAYEARAQALPDFRDYVVGEVPPPHTSSRDPFRDDTKAPVPAPSVEQPRPKTTVQFQLNGIVERQGERVALFGRQSVRAGESIAGWKVQEIGPRHVVLERGGRTRRLSL